MGLDMYFYLREASYIGEGAKKEYPQNILKLISNDDYCAVAKMTRYQIGYFRKFNALHNYIVENCAEGNDDCQTIVLDTDVVDELIETLGTILKDNSKAEELLPTASGFFFGGQEYDEYYFEDVKEAYELFTKLKPILSDSNNKYELIYEASW